MLRKPLASYKKVNSKQSYRTIFLKNSRSKAGGEREQSEQNVKCDATRVPGVLEGRARPCSMPNSISFIASVISQICQLARMRKRKISVLKNQSRNLSKKSKIIEFLIKVFGFLLSLTAAVCQNHGKFRT